MKRKDKKPVQSIEVDKAGNVVFNLASTAANDDWIRSARLLQKVKEDDKKAERKLEVLDNTPMYYYDGKDDS